LAVTHHATIRNTLANAVLTAIDQDVGAGSLIFQTSASAEVATLTLTDPAGSVTGAVLTFSALTADSSATGGVTTKFVITDNSGDEIVYGSVGTSGEDINLSSTTVGAGDTVSITALTYTSPV
jgi:hypothetical protein